MFSNLLTFIEQNTELLHLNINHLGVILSIVTVTSIFKYSKQHIDISNIEINIWFEKIGYTGLLFVLIALNIIDTIQPCFYLIYFVTVLPYVTFSLCNYQTKTYFLVFFNICYLVSTHLNPFLSIQTNEVWVYVLVVLCLCMLRLYYTYKQVVLVLLLLMGVNLVVIGLSCIVSSIDRNALPLYVKLGVVLLLLLMYVSMFLMYYVGTRLWYKAEFELLCKKLESVSRVRVLVVGVSLVVLSLCIRNIYVYNMLVYQILSGVDLVLLLEGSKNPHHEWMCGPGLKHLFGGHCRRMSILIYKQNQQDELRQLYKEILALEKEIPKTDLNKIDKWQRIERDIRRHCLRHYSCLVTKNDGTKINTFVTHSTIVYGEETLPFIKSDPKTRMTRTGIRVGPECEKEHLSDIGNMRETSTDELNKELVLNPKEHIENTERQTKASVKANEENLRSVISKAKTYDIPGYRQGIKELKQPSNVGNNEVD